MKTKTIKLTIDTGFTGCQYDYEVDIDYDGTDDDLEHKICEYYEDCIQEIIQDFSYEWIDLTTKYKKKEAE